MSAYLLLLVAVLTRLLPIAGRVNFTAVTGALLFFGARRPWREMIPPLAALAGTDFILTVYVYKYPFQWQGYALTWVWYIAAMVLGRILLQGKPGFWRVATGALLGPTAFWVVSNYAVWAGSAMYPHTLSGFGACFVAAIPFYRNDLVSTAIVVGVAFGVPALVRRMTPTPALEQAAK